MHSFVSLQCSEYFAEETLRSFLLQVCTQKCFTRVHWPDFQIYKIQVSGMLSINISTMKIAMKTWTGAVWMQTYKHLQSKYFLFKIQFTRWVRGLFISFEKQIKFLPKGWENVKTFLKVISKESHVPMKTLQKLLVILFCFTAAYKVWDTSLNIVVRRKIFPPQKHETWM